MGSSVRRLILLNLIIGAKDRGDTMPGYLLCQSDARAIPLPDRSVHCVICSPPYFGLRDYGTAAWEGGDDPACDHVAPPAGGWQYKVTRGEDDPYHRGGNIGQMFRSHCRKCGARRIDRQIGLEDSIEAYVDVMVRVFREVRRCLRDDGTLWLNMGDSMAGSPSGNGGWDGNNKNPDGTPRTSRLASDRQRRDTPGLAPKNLLGMPWRVAFALQADGWVLRSDIIWAKANPMPESVTDRPTKSHEYLFLLSKQSTYYYDAEAVREGGTGKSWNSAKSTLAANGIKNVLLNQSGQRRTAGSDTFHPDEDRTGRNLRSVWTLSTESWPGAHFATFPRKLVEPCVKAGSSQAGACPRCGAGWTRQVEPPIGGSIGQAWNNHDHDMERGGFKIVSSRGYQRGSTLGWVPSCSCPPHAPVPAIVLDPFCGSGTVMVVANALGRRAIGLDLSREYLTNQAQRRLDRPHAPHIRPVRVEPAMPLFREED